MSVLGAAALGSGVSGALGIVGSAVNYAFQKKLAAQQNEYNLDMWKMQADYNSPQAQMQRYQEAGLNPNLIYGQGNSGNMSNAPQLVTPQAPEISRHMAELGKAFNIESLRTLVANRKKAENEARIAELAKFDREDERDALARLMGLYTYDMSTGRWKFSEGGVATLPNPRGSGVGNNYIGGALLDKYLAEHDPRMFLMSTQRRYLEPQIWMSNYEKEHYPVTYWVGQGTKSLNAIGNLIPKLKFSREMGSMPQYKQYKPAKRVTTYY